MRVCARSGCNSTATATLSYDRIALVAYLVTADDPTAREPGDLCERHVARLVLPRQWELDDRRAGTQGAAKKPARAKKLRVVPSASEAATPRPAARPKRVRAAKPAKWNEVGPSLFDAPTEAAAPTAPAPTPVDDGGHRYMPRFGPETDDDVLDAKTPLLRRAFGGR
jgi:hypothetical protein